MMLQRPQTVFEILTKNVGKIKWYMLGHARHWGSLNTGVWPPIDLDGLKSVRVDVEYDLLTLAYKCTLTYRTPTNTWASRFIITDMEIQSAQGM